MKQDEDVIVLTLMRLILSSVQKTLDLKDRWAAA
jgi:hypothetical protein